MEEDFVKEAHDSFSLFEFLKTPKRKNSAVVVITPNQLINCKTTNDGAGNHAPMLTYIADRIIPGELNGYLNSRDDVYRENAVLLAGKILDEDCLICKLSNEGFGGILAWYLTKSGKINSKQYELLKKFLNDNRDSIERTGTKIGVVGECDGEAISINELIKFAESKVDPNLKMPEIFSEEDIIGITPDRENEASLGNEQK